MHWKCYLPVIYLAKQKSVMRWCFGGVYKHLFTHLFSFLFSPFLIWFRNWIKINFVSQCLSKLSYFSSGWIGLRYFFQFILESRTSDFWKWFFSFCFNHLRMDFFKPTTRKECFVWPNFVFKELIQPLDHDRLPKEGYLLFAKWRKCFLISTILEWGRIFSHWRISSVNTANSEASCAFIGVVY